MYCCTCILQMCIDIINVVSTGFIDSHIIQRIIIYLFALLISPILL